MKKIKLGFVSGLIVLLTLPTTLTVSANETSTSKSSVRFESPGDLAIGSTSSFNFEKNAISTSDETYTAKNKNSISVTDLRGTNTGWTLGVAQDGQLKNAATLNKELTGAQLTISDVTVLSESVAAAPETADKVTLDPEGAVSVIMSAKNSQGAGEWIAEMNNVQLTVPGKTVKDPVSYTTTLTWSLSDVPSI